VRHDDGCGCGCADDTGGDELFVRVWRDAHGYDIVTDLHRLAPRPRAGVIAALVAHLEVGEHVDALAKAENPAPGKANQDPRYPVIAHLIRQARRDWATYGEMLVERVLAMFKSDPKVTPKKREELQELFRAHEAAIVLRWAGVGTKSARRMADKAGFTDKHSVIWSHIDVAFRAGLGLDAIRQAVQHEDPDVARAQLTDVVETFGRQPMTRTDEAALDYARQRAARLMRRPIRDQHDAVMDALQPQGAPVVREDVEPGKRSEPKRAVGPGEAGGGAQGDAGGADDGARDGRAGEAAGAAGRVAAAPPPTVGTGGSGRELTEREYAAVRPAVQQAIMERRTARELARELRAAVAGTKLTNEMERVARTELRDAHANGAYQALKEQAGSAGLDDPEVYKITSPTGCRECIRIWGRGGSRRYRLSQVEAWEAQGGNYGRPPAQWGPTIGTVHPNCTCGPLLLYVGDKEHAVVLRTAESIINEIRAEQAAARAGGAR
jgi:hypothetical protein